MENSIGEENSAVGNDIQNPVDPTAKTNLIINYLPQTFVDGDLRRVFSSIGEVTNAKVMRDKKTGYSYGFGFVNYTTAEDAKRAIDGLNGLEVQGKRIKVSYARPPGDERRDTNIYVTHLPKNMTDAEFAKLFAPYGTIIQTNLLRDKNTGLSRGVGFVRYDKKEEALYAIECVNGMMLPSAMQPLNAKIAEEHGKMKASYFAGMQAGKSMAMGGAYGGFSQAYAEPEADYGGFGSYATGYETPYDASAYAAMPPIQRPRFPPGQAARPALQGLMGSRPTGGFGPGMLGSMRARPPPPPIAGGPMKTRMQGQKRFNPMGGWDGFSGYSGGNASGWTAQ